MTGIRILILISINICLLVSCKENDNKRLIKKINELQQVDTVYEFAVDSNNNIIDTLMMHRLKTNDKGEFIFIEEISMPPDPKRVERYYYRENGETFYQQSENSSGDIIKYEAWEKDGRTYKSRSIAYYQGEKPDTIWSTYKYQIYEDGKLKIVTLTDNKGLRIDAYHNNNGRKTLEVHVNSNDTIRIEKLKYEGGRLKSREISYAGEKVILEFENKDDYLLEKYNNDSLVKAFFVDKDEKGNIFFKNIKRDK